MTEEERDHLLIKRVYNYPSRVDEIRGSGLRLTGSKPGYKTGSGSEPSSETRSDPKKTDPDPTKNTLSRLLSIYFLQYNLEEKTRSEQKKTGSESTTIIEIRRTTTCFFKHFYK